MNKDEILNFIKEHGIRLAKDKLEAYFAQQARQAVSQQDSEASVIEPEVVENSEYEDGDLFEAQFHQELQDMSKDLTPEKMLVFVGRLTKMVFEVQKFCEVQENKRTLINAQREVMVQKIQAKKEVMLAYLEKSFDERKENFAKLFSLVDRAMDSNNNEQLALALQSINLLAAESPFKALRSVEETQKALEDKNHEWDF